MYDFKTVILVLELHASIQLTLLDLEYLLLEQYNITINRLNNASIVFWSGS